MPWDMTMILDVWEIVSRPHDFSNNSYFFICHAKFERYDEFYIFVKVKRLSMEKPGKFEKKWQSQFPRISLFLFKTIDFPSETNNMKSKIQYLLCWWFYKAYSFCTDIENPHWVT